MPAERERDHDDATLPMVVTRTGGGGGRQGQRIDATAAMPGAIKRAEHLAVDDGEDEGLGTKADLRRRYYEFVYYLAHPDDPLATMPEKTVAALAKVFDMEIAEAEERQVELHDAMSNAVRASTFGDALRKKNVDVNARTARLSDFVYSPDPKVALVAIKILNDMDDGATSSTEETIEDHIAALLDGGDDE